FYFLADGEFSARYMRISNPDDAWYYNFLKNTGKTYELNLDTNELSGDKVFIFVNYRSDARDAEGQSLVVAGGGLDMSQLAAIIRDYRIGSTGQVMLVQP